MASPQRPSAPFIKTAKAGEARLKLIGHFQQGDVPVYGNSATVTGVVEVLKPDSVTAVEVKIEGRLKLHEIAEGGSETAKLSDISITLWSKSQQAPQCPPSLPFTIPLPGTFTHDGDTYPLPPTFETKLPGMPGFTASIDYRMTAVLSRPSTSRVLAKASLFGSSGPLTLSTPFIYQPRTRPSQSLPQPLAVSPQSGFLPSPDWRCFQTIIKAKAAGRDDIHVKFYIPISRIFHYGSKIPFHVQYESTSFSLAGFLPYGPTSQGPPSRRMTKIEVTRQTVVDVRNADMAETKTDIWRLDKIGEGTFIHTADGPTWIGFNGSIDINSSHTVPTFRAAGLTIKDSVVFTMTPLEPHKCPWRELRIVVPIRLTTDAWSPLGVPAGGSLGVSEYSIPSTPSEEEMLHTPPTLAYAL
ncbi:hypothetical protein DL96DRAFT_1467234 [Flagelloscypha sp. PMI_526]|nr:hypothetical protein DL96DRAFT_1467234 [Flagelloscypha sp. PMI_526]